VTTSETGRNATSSLHSWDASDSIPSRFRAVVNEDPDRPALTTETGEVSYGALLAEATMIAGSLESRLGSGTEPVGVLMNHSPAIVGVTLGVLLAGRPYLGLSPYMAAPDLRRLIRRVGAIAVVADDTIDPDEALGVPSLLCDDLGVPSERMCRPTSAESLASLLATSGTTGPASAVVDNHANILNNIVNYSHFLDIRPGDVHSCAHPIAFGASRLDVFGGILNGATLAFFDPMTDSLAGFQGWLVKAGVSILHLTPSLFRSVVPWLERDALEADSVVRVVHLGSEPVTTRDLRSFEKTFPVSARFVNRYGATETGTIAMHSPGRDAELHTDHVPVGKPCLRVMFADESRQFIDRGPGEIVVASEYLALGYAGDAEKTHDKFTTVEGVGRVYFTGDRGKLENDGSLVHLGRVDRLTKVNGKWVNLQTIETAIMDHVRVHDCVVVDVEDASGRALVGLLVDVKPDEDDPTSTIKRWLRDRVTRAEVPRHLVRLPALPSLPRGKTDLGRARQIAWAVSMGLPGLQPLESDRLLRFWVEALGLRSGSSTKVAGESFFELGGDSLRAMHLLARVEAEFEIKLPLSGFLLDPTLRGLAQTLTREDGS